MWFEELTGFKEVNPKQVRENLTLEGTTITSIANGANFDCGQLEVATLHDLRKTSPSIESFDGKIKVSEVVGDIQMFHQDIVNQGALIQAASQFNLLEMTGPGVIPEQGIGIYEYDRTQGPACAIACGPGTIYRNYFVPVNGKTGQSIDNQIDCLDEIGSALGNKNNSLWQMQNGYALVSIDGLKAISTQLRGQSDAERIQLQDKLKVGIQWDTEVTISLCNHHLTQVYCSALPVAYSNIGAEYWEDFARLILEALYEATMYAAIMNFCKTRNNRVYLTLVGGGAFGNKSEWIYDAIRRAILRFQHVPLDVKIVSYGQSNTMTKAVAKSLSLIEG